NHNRLVTSLTPYIRNARTHTDKQIDQIVASIRGWGFTIPILVDESGGIIAGHARLLALGIDRFNPGLYRVLDFSRKIVCEAGQRFIGHTRTLMRRRAAL